MGVHERHRTALRIAIQRLLDGDVGETNGELTWANVVSLSKVPRATAYRCPDLIQEWKSRCSVQKLADHRKSAGRHSVAAPKGRKKDSTQELRRTIGIMANHIQALSLYVDDLSQQLARERLQAEELQDQVTSLKASSGQHGQPVA